MKKMIMLVAVAISAVVAQAAAVNWSATNIQPVGSESVGTYVGYLIMDKTAAEVDQALKDGTIADIASDHTTVTPPAGRAKSKISGTATTSHVEADGAFDAFLVVFNTDSSQYIMASWNGKVSDTLGSATVNFGGDLSSKTWAANPHGGDVPEPTSGLLLLVGGAMLALRRRRA